MQSRRELFAFLLPGGFVYLGLFVLPSLAAFFFSLTDWKGVSPDIRFVGLENFRVLLSDPLFLRSLGNNARFTLVVLTGQTLLALIFALFLVQTTRWNAVLRTVFFTPLVVSSISVAFIWGFIYDPNLGILNAILRELGVQTRSWVGDPNIALYALAWVQIWTHVGEVMLFFIAGLQTIPQELYEVAKIEGASGAQRFRYVTWPLLAPATAIVMALTTIQSFKAFDLIFVMTGGGPAHATSILSLFIYQQAFTGFKFGYASAAAVVFMAIISLITYLQFRFLKTHRASY